MKTEPPGIAVGPDVGARDTKSRAWAHSSWEEGAGIHRGGKTVGGTRLEGGAGFAFRRVKGEMCVDLRNMSKELLDSESGLRGQGPGWKLKSGNHQHVDGI